VFQVFEADHCVDMDGNQDLADRGAVEPGRMGAVCGLAPLSPLLRNAKSLGEKHTCAIKANTNELCSQSKSFSKQRPMRSSLSNPTSAADNPRRPGA